MFRSFIVMMFAFCCAGFAYAQSDVSLDIAGVTLDMSYIEAQAIAEKKGYQINSNDGVVKGPSFEEFVEVRKKTRDEQLKWVNPESVVHKLNLTKSDSPDETIEIDFLPMPQGPVMASVTYVNKTDGLSFDDFLSLAKEKYGETKKRGPVKKVFWYDKPLLKNGRAPSDARTLELNGLRSKITLKLSYPEARLELMTAVQQEIEAGAKKHKPTF